jgi:glycosyltransferase involved in cell wall biosynthesis
MPEPLSILAVEPYHGGSHRFFLEGLQKYSRHRWTLLSLPARYWKWRMHGGAVTLAEAALELEEGFDLIFASDMLNLPNFLAVARSRFSDTPVVSYFHENQATYPMPPYQKRDLTYAYINWASVVAADSVWFNSRYHLEEFFAELPRLLKHFPDYQNLGGIATAREKSKVVEPGLDLSAFDQHRVARGEIPRILWNHRWEYDKNPEAFFQALAAVKARGVKFELVLAGMNTRQEPEEFLRARDEFAEELVHYGYAPDFAGYARLVWSSHIVVSTAMHEFFGMSCLEAMYCGCHPLLPDRLNYPSLVPAEYLYRSENELVERLTELLTNPELLRPQAATELSTDYDWPVRAPQFDTALERLVRA